MARIKLPGPSYESQSVNADGQRTVNLYPERIESGDGNTDLALYSSPGLKTRYDLSPIPPPETCTGIQNALVSVSAAAFKNSFNVPVPLIAAPGANRIIVPLNAYQQYTFGTVPYTLSSGSGTFGLGSVFADVVNGFQLFLEIDTSLSVNDYGMVPLEDSAPSNALDVANAVNQPLSYVNQHDVTADPADGTFIFSVQYVVIDVTSGIIFGGTGHNVYGSKTVLSNAQIAAAVGAAPAFGGPAGTPIQLVPAPGADRIIVPLSSVTVSGFTATPMSNPTGPFIGFGPTWNDAFYTNALSSTIYDSNTNNLAMDGPASWSTDNKAVSPINQPLLYGVLNSAPGDSTATVYVQYLIVDLTTGHLIESAQGDVDPCFVPISAESLKGAFTTAVPLLAAQGANKLAIPACASVQSMFNTAAMSDSAAPVIGNGVDAPTIVAQDEMFIGLDLTATVNKFINAAPALFKLPSTDVVNGLIQWADGNDLGASTGDTTVQVAMPFLAIDMNTGAITSGCNAVPTPPTPTPPPPVLLDPVRFAVAFTGGATTDTTREWIAGGDIINSDGPLVILFPMQTVGVPLTPVFATSITGGGGTWTEVQAAITWNEGPPSINIVSYQLWIGVFPAGIHGAWNMLVTYNDVVSSNSTPQDVAQCYQFVTGIDQANSILITPTVATANSGAPITTTDQRVVVSYSNLTGTGVGGFAGPASAHIYNLFSSFPGVNQASYGVSAFNLIVPAGTYNPSWDYGTLPGPPVPDTVLNTVSLVIATA